MRTIKFRAKDFDGVWHYGSLGYTNILDAKIYSQTENGSLKITDWLFVTPDTIGQFTGLYDAHGKEIYEGDILKWKADNRLYAVVFKWGMFYASVEVCNQEVYGGFPLHALAGDEKGIEIVGNIYDNPELKKKYKEIIEIKKS